MANGNYSVLKDNIDDYIKQNGDGDITGQVLQTQLFAMINSLGAGYQFMGVAKLTPTPTDPGAPDQNVFYVAFQPGIYGNFGSQTVADGEVAFLKYNGSWSKEVTGAATAAQVSQLREKVDVEVIGNIAIEFDFSTGGTAAYASRYISYDFKAGKVYLLNLKTADATINTYFSLRDSSGNVVDSQNNLNTGKGARLYYIKPTADAARLYMTYSASGPAIKYKAELGNVVDPSIFYFAQKNIPERLTNIEAQVLERKLPVDSDFTLGKRLNASNGSIINGTDYFATESYFFFAKGTKIKVTSAAPSGGALYCIYDEYQKFLSTPSVGTGGSNLVTSEYTFSEDGYARFSVYSYRPYFSISIVSPADSLYERVGVIENGEIKNIQVAAQFANRGCYIDLNLTLQSSNNYTMSAPILVKAGQTIRMSARGTGTPIFLLVGVDSSVPITSASDVRTFTRLVDNYSYDSAVNITSEWTATEDTYVIAQYYRITNGGYLQMGYKAMNERVSGLDANQREILDAVKLQKPWVKDEVSLMVGKLRALSKTKLLAWVFNTDQHYSQANDAFESNAAILRGLQSIGSIAGQFPLDLVVLGGDEAGYSGETTLEKVSADVAEVLKAGYTSICPVVAMAGNHDAYQNMGAADSDGYQEFNWKTRGNVARRELDWAGIRSTNCWFDDSTNKVRYIFLDKYSQNQGTWPNSEMAVCLSSALADEKLRNSDWQVLVFSHNTIAAAGGNTSDPMPDVVWDAMAAALAQGVNIVACVNGHAHTIQQGVKNDVLMICVGQALEVKSGTTAIHASFDGNIYYNVPNSAKETSYAVFAYDRTNNKLYAFQYGAGTDRVFDTTPGQRGIELDVLSGVVSSSDTVEGGTIKATNHNTEYSVTLDSTGAYTFQYLCPGLDWTISVELEGGATTSQVYPAMKGAHTLNITV